MSQPPSTSSPPLPALTFTDDQAFRAVSFAWAKAADTKDFALLSSICAAELNLNYSGLSASMAPETRTRADFVENFVQKALGDPRLHTQHLLGNVVFRMTGADRAVGEWQIRARHVRDLKEGTTAEWTVGGFMNHLYAREGEGGEWKLAGVEILHKLVEIGQWGDVIGQFD